MQGEVEIPFSSPSFIQIKFHSLILSKSFSNCIFCAYFPGTQVKFIFTKKNEANPRSSFTTSGLFARGHEPKKPYYSHSTIYVHLKRFISNLCVFVNNYHLQFILMFSTLKKFVSLVYCRLLPTLTSCYSTVWKKRCKGLSSPPLSSPPLPSPPLSLLPSLSLSP